MEGVYLLCSITSTAIQTSVKSLLLAFQSLPLLLSRPTAAAPTAVYEGRVHHARRRPVPHSFDYPVRYALIDLDLSPQPPHLSAARAREVAATDGPVFLLTIPESVGYEQNPLSVYYCYDMAGEGEEAGPSPSLKKCIAEVTNTPWGERVSFVFDPRSDLVAKPLHVSPFMDMLGNWSIRADEPGDILFIKISVQHPTLGNYFNATLSAKRVYLSSSSHCLAIYFWLMPHKVAIWIYWQALKLWWKNVAYLQHPKYSNPRYREDSLIRDQELNCLFKTGPRESHLSSTRNGSSTNRWCLWTDAKWPWS